MDREAMRIAEAILVMLAGPVWVLDAATVRESRLGLEADENRCVVRKTGERFDSSAEQIFLRFVSYGLRRGDRLQIEWISPGGEVVSSAPYEELPAASSLCFLSALPVAGYAAGGEPGAWLARVSINGVVAHEKRFVIAGVALTGELRISAVRWRQEQDGRGRIELDAVGMRSLTTINVARYRPAGGWEFVLSAMPDAQEAGRLSAGAQPLEPGQYYAILRSESGEQSPPFAFQVATRSEYRLPALDRQTWRITQGPFGSFSHWGRSIHAWDMAPVTNRLVAAMRPGVVVAKDRGLGQTPRSRSYGNYISIDHGDGEYSHYAHLKTRTFLVRTGDRVDAGQPLAEAGTSGYSFGVHLHVHVTKAPNIASMSIPFRFAELGEGKGRNYRGPVVSQNRPTGSVPAAPRTAVAAIAPKRKPKWQGAVAFAQWWSKPLEVGLRARTIEVWHGWDDPKAGFDLYLVSPSGKKFVHNAGERAQPLRVASPEPGQWYVYVQAVQGDGGAVPFWVDATVL